MESASLHDQHQLQQHFIGCSSLPSQSAYGVSITHDCNSSFILNESDYDIHVNEILPSSRELWPKSTTSIIEPHVKTSMIQDLGFHGARSSSFTHQSPNIELHLAKIKEGMSNSFPKFSTDMVYGASNAEELHLPSVSYNKYEQECCHDLLLSNFSFGHQITGLQCSAGELFSDKAQNNSACFEVSSSLGLNLQASDLLNSIDYGGSFGNGHGPSFQDNIGLYTQIMSLGHDQMQESSNSTQSSSSKKTSVFMKGVARTRPCFPEPKAHQAAAKKPRLESQPSYSPLKVRKEKLGDRIAALQRLVSPFGKTDTASVLTEAIGYIQFLQDQIQTLSVPYINSSGSKPFKTMKIEMGSKRKEDGKEEAKQDLRSRGLCLVPVSYFTNYSNGRNGGDRQ